MNSYITNGFGRLIMAFSAIIVLSASALAQTPVSFAVEDVKIESPRVGSDNRPVAESSGIKEFSFRDDSSERPVALRPEREQQIQRFAAAKSRESKALNESVTGKPLKIGRSSGRWVIPDGATEWGFELGVAWDAATWMSGPKYYDLDDRGHILGSLRWGKVLGTRAFVTYSWAIEVMPLNVALNNEVDNPRYLAGAVNEPRRNREATHGLAINPASFRFIFFPQYRLRPQVGAGFGIAHHFKRMPTVEGTKMNFQADFQIGGQYMLKENKALNFGYRYFHSSNLYIFDFNPGYNMNMWFVGYSIFK